MTGECFHPIRIVALRTGLSPHRIRIWERRYHAVLPSRSGSNRRFYSEADVERLALLWRAVRQGHSIGRVAGLGTEDLRQLLEAEAAARWSPEVLSRGRQGAPVRLVIEECIAAAAGFDARALEDILQHARVELGRTVWLESVVGALLEHVGDLWQRGRLRSAEEHLVSATVRNLLAPMTSLPADPQAPTLVVSTPAGQVHEFGALLAAASAAGDGWNVTYLGPCLPAEEIAAAAIRCGARAVALSIVHPAEDVRLVHELQALPRLVPAGIRVLVGGRAAVSYAAALAAAGVRLLPNLAALRSALEELRAA